jgi:hypothetical protein
MLVCDGLKGLPDAVETVWPQTIVQTCVVHLLRNSFRYAARQDWDKIAKLLKPVYTAPTEDAALKRFAEFADAWGRKYPAIVKLWENAWEEFTPFLRFDTEIRSIVCTTNAIESVNARIRRAVPRALPERAGRTEVRPHGDHVARPSRGRSARWKHNAVARSTADRSSSGVQAANTASDCACGWVVAPNRRTGSTSGATRLEPQR